MRFAVVAMCVLAGVAHGQASRDLLVAGSDGVTVERSVAAPMALYAGGAASKQGVRWAYLDSVSIPESVALGVGEMVTWVGHGLNDARLGAFATTGKGVPGLVWSPGDMPLAGVGVGAARGGSLGAVLLDPRVGSVSVRAFDGGSGAPVWEYSFGWGYHASTRRSIAVNADGSRVAACAFNGKHTRLVVLDGGGGVVGSALIVGACAGLEMDDSGGRVLVSAGATARLFDAATVQEVSALGVSGAGGFHRISRDGTAIAAGGFGVRAWRESGGVWHEVYADGGAGVWFGGVALSGDGRTLFASSHDLDHGCLTNQHLLVDLETGGEIGRWGYTGRGVLQNAVVAAEADDEGEVFAVASWGDADQTQPEVLVFDRGLGLIGSIDTPGSVYGLAMSRDGRHVVAASKAVHANIWGNGGSTEAYGVPPACFADVTGDGLVDTRDVVAFLNAWAGGERTADCTGEGAVDTRDVICFLNGWAAGC